MTLGWPAGMFERGAFLNGSHPAGGRHAPACGDIRFCGLSVQRRGDHALCRRQRLRRGHQGAVPEWKGVPYIRGNSAGARQSAHFTGFDVTETACLRHAYCRAIGSRRDMDVLWSFRCRYFPRCICLFPARTAGRYAVPDVRGGRAGRRAESVLKRPGDMF